MRILDFDQKSPEWYAARRGLPTASEFGNIITQKKGEYAAAADSYIDRLIDELVRPQAAESFEGNKHTRRGEALEPEARELYAFEFDCEPRQVGLVTNDEGTLGCSPDSLLGEDGGLEIKCPDGPTFVKWARAGGLPDEHKAQVHGSLIITGRARWTFMAYCPGYKRYLWTVTPDAFTDKLRGHLDRFLADYAKARELFKDRIP